MAQANIKAVITAEDRASKTLKGIGDNTAKMSNRMKLAIAGTGLALVRFAQQSLVAFEKQENAEERLRGAILNVTSARSKNVNGLLEQARALQQVTRFSDEQVVSAQGILATYQLNQDQIKTLTPRLIDMAEGMATVSGTMPDLEQNAKLVAKAVGGEDTDSLVGVLRRANIMLTNHQQEVLKTGNFQQRMSEITKVLDMNVGGLGEKMGKTTSGHIAIFNHNLDESREKIGSLIASALNPLLAVLVKYPIILKIVVPAVLALAAAFIAVKVAAAVSTVMSAARASILAVGSASTATSARLLTLRASFGSVLALAGPILAFAAVVVGAFAKIRSAAFSAISALDNANSAADNAGIAMDQAIRKINSTNLSATQKANLIRSAYGSIPRQMGGPVSSGHSYMVGESGPELFVPGSSGKIIPNGQVPVSSSSASHTTNVHFNVNIGMFAGTLTERRQIAKTLFRDFQDSAKQFGVSPSSLLDNTNGVVIR